MVRERVGGAANDEALRVLVITFKTACAALTFRILESMLNAPEEREEEEVQREMDNHCHVFPSNHRHASFQVS